MCIVINPEMDYLCYLLGAIDVRGWRWEVFLSYGFHVCIGCSGYVALEEVHGAIFVDGLHLLLILR